LVEGKLFYKTINVLRRRIPVETNMLVTYWAVIGYSIHSRGLKIILDT